MDVRVTVVEHLIVVENVEVGDECSTNCCLCLYVPKTVKD